ncbi:MAG: ribonuclease PH [Candidatus Cloacimonetes bacterium]|nr:ribonuclease PH [Candidatus Cloacimonadota bacterium]
MTYKRSDKRRPDELREIKVARNYLRDAGGSVLVEMGNTKVICTVSVEYRLPQFLRNEGKNQGWLTAEYDMLPRSATKRIIRDRVQGQIKGRTQEIQRLIGRSLRAVTDLTAFPERTIYLDCDVIQADGGTRTAAINGSFIALYDAFTKMKKENQIKEFPLKQFLGAISVGLVDGKVLLDLDYNEDMVAEVDMNIVKDEMGNYIEIQGSSEHNSFSDSQLQEMLQFADNGTKNIIEFHKQLVLKDIV